MVLDSSELATTKYTAMAYSDFPGAFGSGGFANFMPSTPMLLDISAIQYLYGANMSYHTGDDVYSLPTANVSGTGWTTI